MYRHVLILACSSCLAAATYEVGPGQAHTAIGTVPWESLAAGDTVRIHYRAEPYREKWVINRVGSAGAPITVSGVPGPLGELPVIEGQNATTRSALSYWGRQRAVIKIGGSSVPDVAQARYIVVENLEVRGAKTGNTYTAPGGATESYSGPAAAITVESADHITIRNCTITDSNNGFFTIWNPGLEPTSNITVSGCRIFGNGVVGSVYEHNVYTEAVGIVFEYNRFGSLRAGASGNNLKDRSAGTVVRCNWIEGGNRQLDLVEEQASPDIRDDPAYRSTFVYGNVLIEPAGEGNRQMIHYGGDGAEEDYRKGTLHLYGNTFISHRTDRTTLLRLSTDDEHCEARNNIVWLSAAAGSTLELLDDTGTANFLRNWLPGGHEASFFGAGAVVETSTVTGASPGFTAAAGGDYTLAAGSPCLGAAVALHADALAAQDQTRQYVLHQSSAARPTLADLGAFEAAAGADTTPPTMQDVAVSVTSSSASITWTSDEAATAWVEYGPTAAYGSSSAVVAVRSTGHTVVLGGLAAATTWHFRVRGGDASGNIGSSADATFTTADASAPEAPGGGGGGGSSSSAGTGDGGGCGSGASAAAVLLALALLRLRRR